MSKKFIALVLFAAMLISMIPVASAEANYTGKYPKVYVLGTEWYAGQNVEDINSVQYTELTPGEYKNAIGIRTLGNGEKTEGITVKVADKTQNAAKNQDVEQTITLSGSYSELQPFYYTYLAQNGVMGMAVKIPVQINAIDDKGTETTVSNSAYISGTAGYMNTYASNIPQVAYITVVLTPNDTDNVYKIWYGNSEMYTLNVKWKNTDNVVAEAKDDTLPTLTVVGVAGAQKENFRADFTQAKWTYPDGVRTYNPGVLKLDIAAMTAADRKAIVGAADGNMTVKVKALDKAGYPYPQGTIVTFQGASNQNMYLGSSDKFVTVNGEASYLIDNMSCFTMTFNGAKTFAGMAAFGPNFSSNAIFGKGMTKVTADDWAEKDKNDNVYLYTLVSGTVNKTNKVNVTTLTKLEESSYVLRFAYSNKAELLGFTLKYQNVARTKSGITLLSDVITVKVGEQVGIPYIIDNPMAMYQGIDPTVNNGEWKYVNEGIAKAGTDVNGKKDTAVVKGVKVGTTYAFCTDYAKEVELVIINVVPADYVEAPVVEEVVEVGTKYVVTASKLNVREGAGTSYSKIRQIDRNTVVTGTEVEGSVWVKLNDGGYVHGKYLAEVE